MKKRYRLKTWVKVALLIIAFITIFIFLLKVGSDRTDRIDKGCMTVISHNVGDR